MFQLRYRGLDRTRWTDPQASRTWQLAGLSPELSYQVEVRALIGATWRTWTVGHGTPLAPEAGSTTTTTTTTTTTATTTTSVPSGGTDNPTVPAPSPLQPSLTITGEAGGIFAEAGVVVGASLYQFRHRVGSSTTKWEKPAESRIMNLPAPAGADVIIEARSLIGSTWQAWTTGHGTALPAGTTTTTTTTTSTTTTTVPPIVGPRPNVVVIMTDDQRYDDMWVMPQTIAAIGDQGVTFDAHYTNYSLCCPSRATMLTGQQASNHGVTFNSGPGQGYGGLDHGTAMPTWLQSQGYTTAHIGKFLNGTGTNVPPGWDEWFGLSRDVNKMYGFAVQTLAGERWTNGVYQTDWIGDTAEDFIRRHDDEPFFLQMWTSAPHGYQFGPPVPPTRYAGAQAGRSLPKPPSFRGSRCHRQAAPPIPRLRPRHLEHRQEHRTLACRALVPGPTRVAHGRR